MLQEFHEGLEKQLSLLAGRLLAHTAGDLPEALSLAREFSDWAAQAAQSCGPWGRESQVLARKILAGLEGGRPVAQALERLSKALTEASQKLELETIKENLIPAEEEKPLPVVDAGYFQVPEDDAAGFKDFTAEAPEHLTAIESNLLALSKNGVWDVLQVFRSFHTLKGISGFMNLSKMAELAHKAEARLEPFKQGQGKPSETLIDWLLQACDLVREQVQAIAQGLPSGRFRVISFDSLAESEGPATIPAAPIPSTPASAGETVENQHDHKAHSGDAFLRIRVEKMDALLEVAGELAICQAQVSGGVEGLGLTGHLAAEASRLGKISRQLQDIVLSLRMVPVEPLFLRMTRLARDLSRKTGKPLALDLHGGETEIDRRMVDGLVEPLVHLIRNAVDHGIENPEQRLKAGKSAEARLRLAASHEGGDFLLEFSDDGRGFDPERLEQKAREMGLWTAPERPPEEWLLDVVFQPGFSTATVVTEVSGRGVGLDAVQRRVQALKGSVEIQSQKGKGTRFALRIPLTLALMDGILVRLGPSRYVLPAFQVLGFLAFDGTQEHSLGDGRRWMTTEEGHLPLLDLQEGFGRGEGAGAKPVLVRVEASGRRACLVVDEVLGKQQVVIKELGESLHHVEGVSGGAILSDGKVGLILDLGASIRAQGAGLAVH